MIADMLSNQKVIPIVTEWFIRGRKLNISFAFITHIYFAVPQDLRLNCMHYFIMKIPNKREFEQIASKSSSDIDFQNFIDLYKKCTAKPYSFLVIDNTLTSDDLSRFRKNLIERIQKLIMTIDNEIRHYKLKYDINTEAVEISALSEKLINMNTLQVKKYYLLIKKE